MCGGDCDICRFGKVLQRFAYFRQHFAASVDSVTFGQVIRIVGRQSGRSFLIFPDERFLGKIDGETLTALHQRRADFRITEDNQLGGPEVS